MRLALCTLALLLFGPLARAAEPATENFKHGINLSHWYAQTMVGHYNEAHLSGYMTEADAQLVKEMGFDHVRLTLSQTVLFDPEQPGELKEEALVAFRERMAWFLDRGVSVIVDLHPDDSYKESLHDAEAADAFVADWVALAAALSDTDPAHVWFEIMNEPATSWMPGSGWREVQGKAVEAIREAAPEHTIVVSAGGWSDAASLFGNPGTDGAAVTESFEPYADPNLVYTFHYYDPHLWTHQGAGWAWEVAQRVKNIPWPVDPADAEKVAAAAVEEGDDEAFGHVKYHAEHGRFGKEYAVDLLDQVQAWQEEHGVPVYVGEFGAYIPHMPRESRLAWTRFIVEQFEERGWGWAMWDYAGGFAVATGEPGERAADAELVEALGLND